MKAAAEARTALAALGSEIAAAEDAVAGADVSHEQANASVQAAAGEVQRVQQQMVRLRQELADRQQAHKQVKRQLRDAVTRQRQAVAALAAKRKQQVRLQKQVTDLEKSGL